MSSPGIGTETAVEVADIRNFNIYSFKFSHIELFVIKPSVVKRDLISNDYFINSGFILSY